MFSVLIVAYKRAQLVDQIIQNIPDFISRIYLHVDLGREYDSRNLEVIELANSLAEQNPKIRIKIQESNLGVGLAVPTALDWAFETSSRLLVLEDDCLPNRHAYEFFRNNYTYLDQNLIICGTSPFDFHQNDEKRSSCTTSKYALISGWMVSKSTWEIIDFHKSVESGYFSLIRKSLKSPKSFIPLSFFYASMIRIRNKEVSAWDSILCFSMLMNGIKSLVPNVTLINNLGLDEVASNTRATDQNQSTVYQKSSRKWPASSIDFSVQAQKDTDILMERSIYRMGFHNGFSPLKSYIRRIMIVGQRVLDKYLYDH